MSDLAYKDKLYDTAYGNGQRKRDEFELFFRRYYEDLCNFAMSYVNDREIAKDIVQSTFLKVWEREEIWKDDENGKAYLFSSVRNAALNHRKHQRVKRDTMAEVQLRVNEWKQKGDSDSLLQKKVEIVHKGIEQLPEKRREIFLLSRESGLTYREIAELLDISIKTVETQIGRSLKSLRNFVAKHFDLISLALGIFLLS